MSADSGLLGIKACIPGALECQGEGSLSSPLLSSTGGLCPPAGSVGQPNCSRVGRGCGPVGFTSSAATSLPRRWMRR